MMFEMMKNNMNNMNEAVSIRKDADQMNTKSVYISADCHQLMDILPLAEKLDALGFDIYCTGTTAHMLNKNMIAANSVIHTDAFDYVIILDDDCSKCANIAKLHSLQSAQELFMHTLSA